MDVGIGYDASIGDTQRLIVEVLRRHEAILNEPPPIVLVDALGPATVNLKAHYWIDGRTLSPHRVRSSALRLIKRALVEHGVSMPDEARGYFSAGRPACAFGCEGVERRACPDFGEGPRQACGVDCRAGYAGNFGRGGLGNEISELLQDIANATIPEAASGNLLAGLGPRRDQ